MRYYSTSRLCKASKIAEVARAIVLAPFGSLELSGAGYAAIDIELSVKRPRYCADGRPVCKPVPFLRTLLVLLESHYLRTITSQMNVSGFERELPRKEHPGHVGGFRSDVTEDRSGPPRSEVSARRGSSS
jgi:hypothetical protein